jgi:hypothetical protein
MPWPNFYSVFLLIHMFFKAMKLWSFSGLKSQVPLAFVCAWSCSYSSLFCVQPCSYLLLFVCAGSKSQERESLTHGWTWHVVECINLIIFFRWARACPNLTFLMLFNLLMCFLGWWSSMKLQGSCTSCFCVCAVLLLFIIVFVCLVLLLFIVVSMCRF